GLPTKAATARSISPASRTSIGFNSTPNDGATAWMAPSWPLPEACLESRNTATRVRPGAISLSSSNHFPPMPYSVKLNPVALPPGRARLSTKPPPTGSPTFTNTIGTARVASSKGDKLGLPVARMTSGASAISSAAYLRTSSVLVGQRVSMRTLWPSIQPMLSSRNGTIPHRCRKCRDARLHRCCRQPYLFQRRQRAQPHDQRAEIVLSHFAEVDVARHRRLEGAAVAADSFDKCLLDLGIVPAADAFSWMRGDVGDLRNAPNILEFVSALPP